MTDEKISFTDLIATEYFFVRQAYDHTPYTDFKSKKEIIEYHKSVGRLLRRLRRENDRRTS